jgi:hypothetical protein
MFVHAPTDDIKLDGTANDSNATDRIVEHHDDRPINVLHLVSFMLLSTLRFFRLLFYQHFLFLLSSSRRNKYIFCKNLNRHFGGTHKIEVVVLLLLQLPGKSISRFSSHLSVFSSAFNLILIKEISQRYQTRHQ